MTLHGRTRVLIGEAMWADRGRLLMVVTHHAPHPLCLPEAHRTGWAAGNAASDLCYLTDAGRIDLWVHGHVHHSVNEILRWMPVVCNPAGPGFSNPAFQDDLVVEVRPWCPGEAPEDRLWWQVKLGSGHESASCVRFVRTDVELTPPAATIVLAVA